MEHIIYLGTTRRLETLLSPVPFRTFCSKLLLLRVMNVVHCMALRKKCRSVYLKSLLALISPPSANRTIFNRASCAATELLLSFSLNPHTFPCLTIKLAQKYSTERKTNP
ncbi:hypothetical protein CEXT_313781 [Caerostris extrusa]|uniref:Uncharacterized protein n=1 Tax=Caerostris extrusa TaxID=172846 RepID=A0AAV4QKD5_CAEEX|nr:hypothetical protein CEXT_313781 [Caerostris extrusa]